ncbi:MAG: MFS transporter [Vulcanimicrobiaceae bacterium]
MTTGVTVPGISASSDAKQAITATLAAVIGWSFDLFDLFIILFVAPTIAPIFFPSSSPTLSLAGVYAAFAVTLLMRPVGAALFGPYADKHGRRQALVVTVVGVGIATVLMGALPTIGQAGLIAPILFIILRLIQGVFVGGVVTSSHTISTESAPPHLRGFLSGLIGGGGAALGGLLASIVFYIVSSIFAGPAFSIWGWRFMFFSSILGVICGLFVFRTLDESPMWTNLHDQRGAVEHTPLRTLFSGKHRTIVLLNIMVAAGAGSAYYLTSGYIPTFLRVVNKVPKAETGLILIVASLIILVVAPLVGHVSELIGRRPTFLIIGVVNLIAIPILYSQFGKLAGDATGPITFYVLLLTVLGNAAYAPVLVFLNERFPTAIRATGTALCWNVGFAIGGIMPTFATLASKGFANLSLSLTIFLEAAMVVYLIGALATPETRGRFE